jgi:hypothetical protein
MIETDFKTVPDELLLAAEAARSHFLNQGYEVVVEGREIAFPLTPALVCTRGHETLIVEVASSLDEKKAMRWIRYCRSQTTDTRFSTVIRATDSLTAKSMSFASKERMGLFMHDDDSLVEVRSASDLALHVDLPELSDLSPSLRPILAPAFAKFAQQDWRDGLSDAYQAAEDKARDYLKAEIDSGRVNITVTKNKKPYVYLSSDINGMTLGQLKNAFSKIPNQNYRDSLIHSILDRLNTIRPQLAHHKKTAAAEAKIRQSAGNHMYTVVTCLEELCTP